MPREFPRGVGGQGGEGECIHYWENVDWRRELIWDVAVSL